MLQAWLAAFAQALARGEPVAPLFAEECYWRDLIAFTWTIRTLEGRDAITAMVATCDVGPSNWAVDGPAKEANGVVEGWITFETAVARGRGYVRLRDGLCWTLLTAARELKGHEEKQGFTREMGVLPPGATDRRTWLERRADEEAALGHETQPYCLIIGGGQGGLGLGARLKRLGVPTLIVDKHPRPGDNWRSRYKSLCLHDPVWYDHMPYLPFPEHWPVFTPKDKLGDWLEMYARVMELNCWNDTTCQHAEYDEAAQRWTVTVDRAGETVTLRPAQLILATGMAGVPQLPSIPGMDSFTGEQHHSSRHATGEPYAGKRCVVIGSNNSAHDICADLVEHGADVTMLQRSSTLVVRSETMLRLSYATLYSEQAVANGIGTDQADLLAASMPYRLLPSVQRPLWERIAAEDALFYDRLCAVGFQLDFGEDASGLSLKYLRRGSGYYIDVGASEMIATGTIKLRGSPAAITPTGVRLKDGSELPADLIVYATGYGSMNGWAEKLISKSAADAVGPCWGLGSGTARDPGPWEGELRNMWKPTAVEALWFHGGNLAQSRHYSRYLALQLKARYENIPTPVYAD
jgi:putative flavoprotein involved in K+ transport